jgi:peptide deformylase
MAKLKILTIPDENLRKVAKPVDKITPEIIKIVDNLFETLKSSDRPGVGLAAPQVGKDLRILVIETEGYQRENGEIVDVIPKMVLINPVITKSSNEKVEIEEGCLSVPDLLGLVTRPKKIRVTALDENGKKIWMTDNRNSVTMISGGEITIKKKEGCKLSLLSFSGECRGVSAKGVKYPLENAVLRSDFPIGASNEFVGETALITCLSGQLLICQTAE